MLKQYLETNLVQLETSLDLILKEVRLINFLKRNNAKTINQFLIFWNNEYYQNEKRLGKTESLLKICFLELNEIINKNYEFESLIDDEIENEFTSIDILKPILDVDLSDHLYFSDFRYSECSLRRIIQWVREYQLNCHDYINVRLLFGFISMNLHKGIDFFRMTFIVTYKAIESIEVLEKIISDHAKENLSDIAFYVLTARYNGENSQTLEEIGQSKGITRERIRQLQVGAERKIRFFIKSNYKKFSSAFGKLHLLKSNQLAYLVMEQLILSGNYKKHTDSRDVYVKSNEFESLANTISEIENIINNQGSILLGDSYNNFPSEPLLSILELDYQVKGFWVGSSFTIRDAFLDYLKNRKYSVCFSNLKDINELVNCLEEIYNLKDVRKSLRTIENIAIGSCFLSDARTYVDISRVKRLPTSLEKEITEVIYEKGLTSGKELFQVFKKELLPFDVENPIYLYSYIKYLYSENYNFGGVSLAISTLENEVSWKEAIISLIRNQKRPMDYSELASIYSGLSKIAFSNMLVNNDEFIQYGNKTIFLKEFLDLENNDKKEILRYVYTNQYVSLSKLLYHLQTYFKHVLSRNMIQNEETLKAFLQYYFPDSFVFIDKDQSVAYRNA